MGRGRFVRRSCGIAVGIAVAVAVVAAVAAVADVAVADAAELADEQAGRVRKTECGLSQPGSDWEVLRLRQRLVVPFAVAAARP